MSDNPSDLAKAVIANRQQISILHEEQQREDKTTDDVVHQLEYDVYRPKIAALEKERDDKVAGVKALHDNAKKVRTEEIEQLSKVIDRVRTIFSVLRASNKDLNINDDDIHVRSGLKESLGLLYQDMHIQVKLFIVENGNPKNKFSLLAFGKTDINTWKPPYSYGLPTYENGWYSLKAGIATLPTVEEARQSAILSKARILKRLLDGYVEARDEFDGIKASYKMDDFERLFVQKCTNCDFRVSIFEDQLQKCPRCDKESMQRVLHPVDANVLIGLVGV